MARTAITLHYRCAGGYAVVKKQPETGDYYLLCSGHDLDSAESDMILALKALAHHCGIQSVAFQ